MVVLNSLDEATVRMRNQGSVDDVVDQRDRALLFKFEERPKSGSVIPSRRCSLQERFFRPSISTHQMLDQHAHTVVSSSRNHPCGNWHK